MYLKKDVKIQDGFINAGIYNFNSKKMFLVNRADAKALLFGRFQDVDSSLIYKLKEENIITDIDEEKEITPTVFEYGLFDDHDTHQVCRTVYFEVTDKCNFNCLHCYAEMGKEGNAFLTPEKYKHYISKLGDNPNFDIRLTGGEPFLNPYIIELINMTEKNIKPYNRHSIVSNGSFELKDAIYALEKGFELQISVYGMSEDTFERFARTNKLMHKKVIDNLKVLSETKYKDQIVLLLSINALTYDDVDSFVNFAKTLGFKPMLNRPASIGRAKSNWETLRLSPEQHQEFNRYNRHLVKGYNRYCYHACRLTWSYIDIYGDVKPCAFIRKNFIFGNINKDSLEDIRRSSMYSDFKQLNASSFEKCTDCEFKYACTGGCCGETLSYVGDITKTYPWCVVRPYEKNYLDVAKGELYQVEKYAGGTFDFNKV